VQAATEFVDTHLHLEEVPDWPGAVDEAVAAGVVGMFAMGTDADTNRGAIRMAEEHPAVWAAVGHHPMNREGPDLEDIRRLARHPRVVAIGEVGLDHSRDEHVGPHVAQERWFRSLLGLALEAGLPVCVHIRDTADDVHRVLAEHPGVRGVIHYWSLDAGEARRFLDLGFHISFAGTITRASKEHVREVARMVPEDRLLLETDAPWGTPRGRSGPMRPAWMVDTAQALAEVRGLTLERLSEIEKANISSLFSRFSC
jgi:TatD DNase family protein